MSFSAHRFRDRSISLGTLCARVGIACADSRAREWLIDGVTADSQSVQPGWLFVAVRGERVDGHDFVADAVGCGAVAVVVERMVAGVDVPQLMVDDSGFALGKLAAHFFGVAGDGLTLIGVTGTNGKSTTCAMLQAMLRAAGRSTAMLGTIEYDLVGRRAAAPWTTPPAVALCSYLAEAREAGADSVVMEVSSHALSQGRVAGLSFDAAVFTNLTQDHLDYHADFDAYLSAKKILFDSLSADGLAVVNEEDGSAGAMVADCLGRVVRFGLDGDGLDWVGFIEEEGLGGSRFRLVEKEERSLRFQRFGELDDCLASKTADSEVGRYKSGDVGCYKATEIDLFTSLIGRHNVLNGLGAAVLALEMGIPVEAVRAGLADLGAVRGRMELVTPVDWPFAVFVDYAHTDDALGRVCSVLRGLTSGRLIVLFGCGGDRDRTKRPLMARAVGRSADVAVVTSDNPRTEDPSAIIDDIRVGFGSSPACSVVIEEDRRRAIELAVGLAEAGDVVLVAGKGHEDYQILGAERVGFDDAVEVKKAIGKWQEAIVEGERGIGEGGND